MNRFQFFPSFLWASLLSRLLQAGQGAMMLVYPFLNGTRFRFKWSSISLSSGKFAFCGNVLKFLGRSAIVLVVFLSFKTAYRENVCKLDTVLFWLNLAFPCNFAEQICPKANLSLLQLLTNPLSVINSSLFLSCKNAFFVLIFRVTFRPVIPTLCPHPRIIVAVVDGPKQKQHLPIRKIFIFTSATKKHQRQFKSAYLRRCPAGNPMQFSFINTGFWVNLVNFVLFALLRMLSRTWMIFAFPPKAAIRLLSAKERH